MLRFLIGKRCIYGKLLVDIHTRRRLYSRLLGTLRQGSNAVGNTNVDVTMKNISSKNITSVIDAIENSDVMSYCRLRAMDWYVYYFTGSLRRSMNSMVLLSSDDITPLIRATR